METVLGTVPEGTEAVLEAMVDTVVCIGSIEFVCIGGIEFVDPCPHCPPPPPILEHHHVLVKLSLLLLFTHLSSKSCSCCIVNHEMKKLHHGEIIIGDDDLSVSISCIIWFLLPMGSTHFIENQGSFLILMSLYVISTNLIICRWGRFSWEG